VGDRLSLCLWAAIGLPLLLLLLVPIGALVSSFSGDSFLQQIRQPETVQAIWLSLKTSALSTLLVLLAGTPVAYFLARSRSRAMRLLGVLIDLPMILPPAVAGLTLLLAFGRMGFVGRWLEPLGIQIAFTTTAVVIAQTFVAAPFYIKAASVGMSAVSPEMEQSAALDGATLFQRLRYVTLPLAFRSMVTGLALCWARALGEFGATIFFAGNIPGRTQTMPLAIYIGFQSDLDQAIALSLILLWVSFLILVVVHSFLPQPNHHEG
jgi:molybdate transport system permease protein